jgi:hypothetical protein
MTNECRPPPEWAHHGHHWVQSILKDVPIVMNWWPDTPTGGTWCNLWADGAGWRLVVYAGSSDSGVSGPQELYNYGFRYVGPAVPPDVNEQKSSATPTPHPDCLDRLENAFILLMRCAKLAVEHI